jgi:TonB-dependent receptor
MRTQADRRAPLFAYLTVVTVSLLIARPSNAAVITGAVKASDASELAGVRIEIPELGKTVTTGANGVFQFVDVPDGRYTLRVRVPGKSQVVEKTVEVAGQRNAVAEVLLEAAGRADGGTPEIVITAVREADPARASELAAPNIINVVTADEIRELPDVSAAEAIRRLPGISAENDTGEARFINIRGLDADLNGTTFAGVRLLPTNPSSPLGGGRAVAFDTIPAGLIGSMTVTKTNTPEMDAEALGGTIEITPRQLGANEAPFVSGRVGSGYEPLRHTWIGDFELAGGTRFGFGGGSTPFSAVGSIAYYVDHRGIDDLEESYVDGQADGVPDKAFNDLQHRYYQLQRKRLGFGGELAYQPSEAHRWYLDAYQSGYVEDQNKDYLIFSFDGAPTVSPTNPNVLVDTLASYDRVNHDHTETLRARLASIGGRDAFGATILDYRVSYAEGRYIVSKDLSWDFQAPGGATISYDNTTAPNWPSYTIGPGGPNRLDPAAYTLLSAPDGVSSGYEHDLDKEVSAVGNLAFPVHLAGGEEALKFGFSARLRDKTLAPLTVNYLSSPTVSLSPYVNSHFITYYKGHYSIGYDFNVGALEGLFASGVGFVPDTVNNDLANAQSWQLNKEDVYAAYGQYSYTHEALGIVAGVRVEHTSATYEANAFNSDTNTPLGVNSQDSTYTNAFPTIQVRYQASPTLVARGTLSSAIARPGFQQITAAISLSPQTNTITQGDPNLKPTVGYNLDLAVDQSFGEGGMISLGVFDKELRNYITATGYRINASDLPANPIYEGFTGVVDVTSYTNISRARVTGTEIAWEQRFVGLPGYLSGLGAGANWTWVNSTGDLRPGRSSALPSTARNTANATLFYEWQHFEAKLAGYYTSRVLFTPNTGDPTGYTDVYQSPRFLLDLGTAYAVNRNAALYLNVKNLTNDAMRYTEGPEYRPIQREFYGVTVQAGVNFQF